MNRHLLLSAMLFLTSAAGWAQSGTFSDPIPIVAGQNSAEFNTSTGEDVVFSYTATEGTKLTIVRPSSMYQTLYATADETTPISGGYSYESVDGVYYYTYIYPVAAGQTVYLAASDNTGTVSFTASMEQCATAGQGVVSADDPITIKAGDSFFIGDGYTNRVSYNYHTYATYTAEESGVLQFTSSSSATVAVNGASSGTSFTSDNATGLRTYNLTVTEGETYTLHFWSSYATYVNTQMTHPEPGSLVTPFTIDENGEYTVPAAAGTYYYYYKPTQTGFITISSDNALPGGQVVLYTARNYVGSYSSAESEEGSYYLRYEISYVYESSEIYLEVKKAQATDADETFNFAYSDYALGEKESNPIVIETEGTDITTGNGETSSGIITYYAYTVPGEGTKIMNVVATSTITNSNTLLRISPQGSYWTVVGQGNTTASGNVTGGSTYIIRVTNCEEGTITFRVTTSEIAQGDIITDPLTAALGENTLTGDGNKYYQYTATMTGKLTVTVADGMSAAFPRSTSQYASYYTTSVDGNNYSISVTEGTTYYITLSGCQSGNTFTLAERDYVQGETRDNPIVMDGNTFDLGNSLVGDVWLQYTCASDGLLKISTDLVGNYNSNHVIEWGLASGSLTSIANYNYSSGTIDYSAQAIVSEGDVYLIHMQLDATNPGKTLTLTLGELEPGMSLATAIELTNGVATKLSKATYALPIWYKINLGAGTATARITSSAYSGVTYPYAYFYANEAEAETGSNSNSINWNQEYDSWSGSILSCTASLEVAEEGYVYFRFDQCSDADSITVSGVAADTGDGSYSAPYILRNGDNTKALAEGQSYTVFKHESTAGSAIYLVSDYKTSYEVNFIGADADTTEVRSGYYNGDTVVYCVPAGQTAYVEAKGIDTVSVNAVIEAVPTAGRGLTADDRFTFAAGDKFFIGDGINMVDYQYTGYATYTATEDGVLLFNASNFITGTINGQEAGFEYAGGHYTLGLTVHKDSVYQFDLKSYNVVIVSTEMTHPEPGSLAMPFEITGDGEYTVPAAIGEYYYVYRPKATGFMNITSNDALGGGKVLIYNSNRYIDYDEDYAMAMSETGSYDVRCEISYTGYTYYIRVKKAELTAADQTFTFAYEPYKAGETADNPIVIESLPASYTTENAAATAYYSYTVPADVESLILTVTATSEVVNELTDITFYDTAEMWGFVGQGHTEASGPVAGGHTYIIMINNAESTPMSFTVTGKTVEQGDVIENPLNAVLGQNTIASDGTKYYQYTATLSGKMSVTVSDPDMTVVFPAGTDSWAGNYDSSVSGTTYSVDVVAGTTYLIRIDGAKADEYFTLAEREYLLGEGKDNPIIVEGNSVTLAAGQTGSLWFKWTAPADGALDINFSATYNWENYAYYGHAEDAYLEYMVTSTGYGETYSVSTTTTNGEEWLVNLVLTYECPGDSLTFTLRALEPGESLSTAIEVMLGETTTLKAGSRTMPTWYKVAVGEGTLSFTPSDYLNIMWYNSLADVAADNGTDIYWDYTYNDDYTETYYGYSMNIAEAGVYYFCLTNGDGTNTLLLEGTAVEGLTAGTAIDIPLNQTTNLPAASEEMPIWCKVTVPETGVLSVTTTSAIAASFVMGEGMMMPIQFDENNSFSSPVPAGEYYIVVSSAAAETGITPVFTAIPAGIDAHRYLDGANIAAGKGSLSIIGRGNVAIYTISGACVAKGQVEGNANFNLASGAYIVKFGDKAMKVMVK